MVVVVVVPVVVVPVVVVCCGCLAIVVVFVCCACCVLLSLSQVHCFKVMIKWQSHVKRHTGDERCSPQCLTPRSSVLSAASRALNRVLALLLSQLRSYERN